MKKIFLQLVFVMTIGSNVFAAPPDWTVNSSAYSNSMSITCVLVTNNEESTDGDDMIGAFINGECRGVKHPVYVESIDRWVVFLVIFSDESSGDVSFKLYDASLDEISDARTVIKFESNAHYGLATAPFVFADLPIPSETEFISFTIEGQTAETHIINNQITVVMPEGTDLSSLVPEFELSAYAHTEVNNSVQLSGVSSQDFTNPVNYSVYAVNDSDSAFYTITVYAGNVAQFSGTNAFSPNGDGINDFWEIDNNEIYRNCDFYIYNINGNQLYHSRGYKNDWNGKYHNSPLPIGTYLYVVKCHECSCVHKGTISLIK